MADVRAYTGLIRVASRSLYEQPIGITDDDVLQIDGTPNSGEYGKFTANGLEGKTVAETRSDLGIWKDMVKDYNANGNGVYDNTTAFQNMLDDFADSSRYGGKVYLPAGTYLCGALTVSADMQYLTMVGEGSATTTGSRIKNTSTSPLFTFAGNADRITFEDLILAHNGVSAGHLIYAVNNSARMIFNRCSLDLDNPAKAAIYLEGQVSLLHLNHSYLSSASTQSVPMVHVRGSNFYGCAVDHCNIIGDASVTSTLMHFDNRMNGQKSFGPIFRNTTFAYPTKGAVTLSSCYSTYFEHVTIVDGSAAAPIFLFQKSDAYPGSLVSKDAVFMQCELLIGDATYPDIKWDSNQGGGTGGLIIIGGKINYIESETPNTIILEGKQTTGLTPAATEALKIRGNEIIFPTDRSDGNSSNNSIGHSSTQNTLTYANPAGTKYTVDLTAI
jgi:hypothetical protein